MPPRLRLTTFDFADSYDQNILNPQIVVHTLIHRSIHPDLKYSVNRIACDVGNWTHHIVCLANKMND
jgi:hypothetical protein